MSDMHLLAGLGVIMGMVLLLPFTVRWIEEELEAFLLLMGTLAVTLSGLWNLHLITEALIEPIEIALAVAGFGFVFRQFRDAIRLGVSRFADRIGLKCFLFCLVAGLGFLSSVITAIIAALVLVEIISGLNIAKKSERSIVVLTCYAIGLGAVLTPIGEPLSTIATAKLAGHPHHAGFFFLGGLLWPWIAGGIALLGLLATGLGQRQKSTWESLTEDKPEEISGIMFRAGRVYVFVAALVLLGHGFTPIVDRYLIEMPSPLLYWVNTVSAVLDNATLAAAEISPKMDIERIVYVLIGLLVSGGMLIPGNIPNIICANKLGIRSGEWARAGVPLGLALLIIYFMLLEFVPATR